MGLVLQGWEKAMTTPRDENLTEIMRRDIWSSKWADHLNLWKSGIWRGLLEP
jgi:hypothetical protein